MITLKRIFLSFVALLLALVVIALVYANYWGMFPRHDYETVAPQLPKISGPAVLVFNKTNGFIHHGALPAANTMLGKIANEQDWQVFFTDNSAIHNLSDLSNFDLVVWNNVSGDVLTLEQRNDLKEWIEQGGGWVGLHATGGDFEYQWDWYVDTLIGAQFVGHTMDPHIQDAEVLVADSKVELTQHIPSPWLVKQEEWYAFDRSPRNSGYEILLTVDEDSYITQGTFYFGEVDRMEGEHPLVWRHNIEKGRAFYSAIGHEAHTYEVSQYITLITNAMIWAMPSNSKQ